MKSTDQTVLTDENKKQIVSLLKTIENDGLTGYRYMVQGQELFAKAHGERALKNLRELKTIIKPIGDDSAIVLQVLSELTPELYDSKIVPIAKVACGLTSVGASLMILAQGFMTEKAPDEIKSGFQEFVGFCTSINQLPNIYDVKAKSITQSALETASFINNPESLFEINTLAALPTPHNDL